METSEFSIYEEVLHYFAVRSTSAGFSVPTSKTDLVAVKIHVASQQHKAGSRESVSGIVSSAESLCRSPFRKIWRCPDISGTSFSHENVCSCVSNALSVKSEFDERGKCPCSVVNGRRRSWLLSKPRDKVDSYLVMQRTRLMSVATEICRSQVGKVVCRR